jgi:hypothetical protein
MSANRREPLWTCPKCGASLVTKNLWHSCGRATLEEWKARMGPRARVRFAGITSLSETGMTCGFALPHPLDSPRLAKVEEVAPRWWYHRLRITDINELDEEIQGWLRDSHRLMGMQERLQDGAG